MRITTGLFLASALAVHDAFAKPVASGSTSTSAATSSATPVCGQTYAGYKVSCGQTFSGNVADTAASSSLEGCITVCDDTSSCIAASFVSGECTLLSSVSDLANADGAQVAVNVANAPSIYQSIGSSIRASVASSIAASAVAPAEVTSASTQSFSAQLSEYINKLTSDAAPTVTGADTAIYIPASAASVSSSSTAGSSLASGTTTTPPSKVKRTASTATCSVSSVVSNIAIIKAARPTPVNFCEDWDAGKPHKDTPFAKISYPPDVSDACNCILAEFVATTTCDASNVQSNMKVIRSVVSTPTYYCQSWVTNIPHASSSLEEIARPEGVTTACECILAGAEISSSLTTKIQTSSTSSSSTKKTSTSTTSSKKTTSTSTTSSSKKTTSTSTTSSSKKSSSSASSTTTKMSSSSTTTSAINTATTGAYVVNDGKRGLAYNDADLTLDFSRAGQDSQVSWAYNWYSYEDGEINPALEYIPLLWSNASDLTSIWDAAAQSAIDNGTTALMSFNEPDICSSGSACMTIDSAVSAYQTYMQPFAGKAKIGAPAVTNGAAPYGLTYLQNFMGNCTDCTIDFIALHWYSNKYAGATYFEEYMEEALEVADGRPIWITEFGLTDEYSYTDAELQAFLEEVMPWMDQQSLIDRYAYFYDAAGYLINENGTGLSGDGAIYNSFTNSTTQPTLS